MKVVIADIRQDSLDRAMAQFGNNSNVHAIRLDVTDREAFVRAADEAERVFGNVHLLCNNAGIISSFRLKTAPTMTGIGLWALILAASSMGFKPSCPDPEHGEGGHIVNTASMAAFLPGLLPEFIRLQNSACLDSACRSGLACINTILEFPYSAPG